jgi:hypothetical protein
MDLPLKFPDRHEEARKRGQAFQRLSSNERWRHIADTVAAGSILIEQSPHRRAIQRLMGEPEEEEAAGHHRAADREPARPLPDLLEGAVRLCAAARR